MIDANNAITPDNTFFHRILRHDAARKGAAAIAGVLVAAVSEALWPTE